MNLAFALLLACSTAPRPGSPRVPGDSAAPDETGDSGGAPDTDPPTKETGETGPVGETGETGEPPPPVLRVETIPDQDADQDGWIFEPTTIHQIEIRLPEASIAALGAAPYEFALAEARFDGEDMPQVGLRLRGRIGSFRTLAGKPKFRIKFNAFVDDQRFYALESVTLNNSVVDCSYLKEPLGYRVFRELGIPTPRTSFAQVRINGADYGLYVLVESVDDRFLARSYADPAGNLYDGKYIWWPDGSYTLIDFVDAVDDLMELEEGTDVGHADVFAVTEAVAHARTFGDYEAIVGTVVDVEHMHRHLVAEQWVGHNDGYAMNTNNYWVYFDPSDGGRADLLPWDLDYSFLQDWEWGLSWQSPSGVLASTCWADAECRAAHVAAVDGVLGEIDAVDMAGFFDELDRATYEAAMADPRRECAAVSVRGGRDLLDAWIDGRSAAVRASWGL